MNKSRRTFLVRSMVVVGLAVTGKLFWIKNEETIPEELSDDSQWLVLSEEDRLVLAVITPVLLAGVVKTTLNGEQLVNYLKDFDKGLDLLPETQQAEFKELLSLLSSMVGRVVVASVWSSWNNVNASTVENMLSSWRTSYLDLMKVAYKGIKELSYASWYGNPQHWDGLKYPGPPEIIR